MTDLSSRIWTFGFSCRSCGRRLETGLVDASSGDNVITFGGPERLYMLCRHCGLGADYPMAELTSRPAGEEDVATTLGTDTTSGG